jgi:uncharacterized integral membrane protein
VTVPEPDTARDLILMAASPPFVGVWALVVYAGRTLSGNTRTPGRGWTTLIFGIVLVLWFAVFVALATPVVIAAFTADTTVEPIFVILAFTLVVVIGLLAFLLARTKTVCRYLVESYRRGREPWLVARLRRWVH